MPQFGYRATSASSAIANGILPLDRPHQIKVFGNYMFPIGLNIGVGLNVELRHAADAVGRRTRTTTNGGEIPDAPRGSGIQTIDGFKTRTPFQTQIDLQAAYALKSSGRNQIALLADIFNLFNQQTVHRLRQLDVDVVRRRAEPELRPEPVEPLLRNPRSSRRRGRSASAPASSSNRRRFWI